MLLGFDSALLRLCFAYRSDFGLGLRVIDSHFAVTPYAVQSVSFNYACERIPGTVLSVVV
jgi:hypothetical protein